LCGVAFTQPKTNKEAEKTGNEEGSMDRRIGLPFQGERLERFWPEGVALG